MSKNHKKCASINCVVYFLILIGILVRVYMAVVHFTHVDDMGALNDMMQRKSMGLSNAEIAKYFWTYAPLQIFFSGILVNKKLSYAVNIFLGRVPSLVCGILSIIMVNRFAKKYFLSSSHGDVLVLALSLICSFSWENIIYSAQAEPYEIVVLGGSVLLCCMADKFYDNWKSTMSAMLIFTAFCYSHYQFFILVFAMYAAVFFCNRKDRNKVIKICAAGIGNFLLTVPLLIYMKNIGMFEKTINWNIGLDGRFLFSMPDGNVTAQAKYLFDFFTKNILVIYKYFMTVSDFRVLSNLLAVMLICISFIGLCYLHKKDRELALYIDILTAVLLVMICRGTLAFGPSRHMLFIFPTMLLLIGAGLSWILGKVHLGEKGVILKWAAAIYTVCFLLSMPNEITERRNYISPKEIQDLAEQYEPDFIYGCEWMHDLYEIEISGYENLSAAYGLNDGWCQKIDRDETSDIVRFMVISRTLSMDGFLNNPDKGSAFAEKAEMHGFGSVAEQFPDYRVIYKKELQTGREVEYASKHYWNWPNGLYIYIFECRF